MMKKIHQPDAEYFEYLAKKYYLIMIVAIAAIQCGISNRWARRISRGIFHCPNFDKCFARNVIKSFVSATPYCFCD